MTYTQIARGFGNSETCRFNWVRRADIEDGKRLQPTASGAVVLREARKRIRILEQENEILRRAAIYLGRGTLPK